jgi:hypothetical protein
LISKPAVDGFERNYADDVRVIRLDVRSRVGNYLAYNFSVRAVPTFIMFRADGHFAGRHTGIATERTLEGLLQEATKER